MYLSSISQTPLVLSCGRCCIMHFHFILGFFNTRISVFFFFFLLIKLLILFMYFFSWFSSIVFLYFFSSTLSYLKQLIWILQWVNHKPPISRWTLASCSFDFMFLDVCFVFAVKELVSFVRETTSFSSVRYSNYVSVLWGTCSCCLSIFW